MKKITKDSTQAFLKFENFKRSNTEVVASPEKSQMFLFGNLIAEMRIVNGRKSLIISDAGWPTRTTRERLNGLPGVNLYVRKGVQFLNGREWTDITSLIDMEAEFEWRGSHLVNIND